MSDAQIFVLAIAGVAVLAAIAVFAVAFRRGGAPTAPPLDARARKRDRSLVTVGAPAVDDEVPVEETLPVAFEEPEPIPDPLLTREEISEEEYGVNRRQFLNRAIAAVFGVFLLQFTLAMLAFLWPKLKAGGFGGKIDAGNVDDLRAQIAQPDGSIVPAFIPAAQAYIVPFNVDPAGSSFESNPNVIAGDLMALWQRCVHLGCRVPVCLPSQGFECPCHGSKYNFHGEYDSGPAPRNLDRFLVEIDDRGHLIVDTGSVIQTARAKTKTIAYPQGPSCLG